MGSAFTVLVLVVVLALVFDYINGFHDTANAVTTVIYTRTLMPTPAVFYTGLMNSKANAISRATTR